MAAYTLQQKTFVFSMISNAAAQLTNATVADLEAAVTKRFDSVTSENTKYLGTGWTLGWGPVVVSENDSKVADNTAFVAKGSEGGNPVYIVAIAGTNAVSAFDIQTEDLDVHTRVPFGSTKAKISQGTQDGVNILEQLTSNGATLQQYLNSVAAKNATLVFTGHSLGGALSPTLALDLAVNQGFDLTKWSAVYVYPSAGPTPGDKAFATLFSKTFPKAGSTATSAWNQNVVNSIDVVPRAWNELNTIHDIYTPNLKGTLCIAGLVSKLRSNRGLINYYDNLPKAQFTGTYNGSLKPAGDHPDNGTVKFAVQVFYQHIFAYTVALIPEFESVFTGGSLSAAALNGLYKKCGGL
ncbi:MAG TPA: hypothetical protein VKB93_09820 [Thermoanaerobaculia bacterium]|nr:hypothetical protein [Thermoanaerobaculia bacterium]